MAPQCPAARTTSGTRTARPCTKTTIGLSINLERALQQRDFRPGSSPRLSARRSAGRVSGLLLAQVRPGCAGTRGPGCSSLHQSEISPRLRRGRHHCHLSYPGYHPATATCNDSPPLWKVQLTVRFDLACEPGAAGTCLHSWRSL